MIGCVSYPYLPHRQIPELAPKVNSIINLNTMESMSRGQGLMGHLDRKQRDYRPLARRPDKMPPDRAAMIRTQITTANQLWKMCQRAPLPTKVGMTMIIPIPIFLVISISYLLNLISLIPLKRFREKGVKRSPQRMLTLAHT